MSLTASTVDQGEVDRHSKLMDVWWQHGALHTFNTLRVPLVVDFLCTEEEKKSPTPLANKKILDIGCGGGIYSEGLAKMGAEVTGVDPSPDLINAAREHSKLNLELADNRPTYIWNTIDEHVKDRPEYYDAVVASEVVEHVDNPELFIKYCSGVLKPNGKIFITTPNRSFISRFMFITVAENIMKQVPKGLHDYNKFITPDELTTMLQKAELKVESVRGIFYYPIIDIFQWVWFHSMWYAVVATKQK